METSSNQFGVRRLLMIAGLLGAGVTVSACDDAEPRSDRAPTAIVVSAAILDDEIALSPARIGAGPISLVISNQTDRTRELELETAGRAAGIRQRTGPINPSDTATLTAHLQPGRYTVSARSGKRTVASTITVTEPRATSNDVLLTP